jgi:hypothetical protein
MVHDEKVTVPPKTETPPPCKHKRETNVKIPLERWEFYKVSASGTYIL